MQKLCDQLDGEARLHCAQCIPSDSAGTLHPRARPSRSSPCRAPRRRRSCISSSTRRTTPDDEYAGFAEPCHSGHTGTRARIDVPRCGWKRMARRPSTAFSRSFMLVRPSPRRVWFVSRSKPTPKSTRSLSPQRPTAGAARFGGDPLPERRRVGVEVSPAEERQRLFVRRGHLHARRVCSHQLDRRVENLRRQRFLRRCGNQARDDRLQLSGPDTSLASRARFPAALF
jgi:hypothetical protein